MGTKLYDICFVAGEYQTQSGEQKKRYENVGVVMNGEYGPYIIMNRHFNPAGVPGDGTKASVILKLFKNEPTQDAYPDPAAGPAVQHSQGAPVFNPNPPTNRGAGVADGEIPF
jgi:hypothetical protein